MLYKKVSKNEYEDLIKLMDTAFNMQGDQKFERLLPKLYFKENKDMIHYGAYEDGKLVASIGLYKMTMVSKYSSIKVGCVGAVSTHPDYRLKGYFKELMKRILKTAKKDNYDLLFLGGNRVRYGRFGFENAGRKFVFNISQRTKHRLKPESFEVIKLNKDDHKEIEICLSLYNKSSQRMLRTKENFYNHVISWNCVPYIVKVNDEIIGYYGLKDDSLIYEFIYKKGHKDTVLAACLLDKKEVSIQTSMNELTKDMLRKIDWYRVEYNEMFNVLNWDNVAKYLNFNESYKEDFKRLNKKERIIVGLGSEISESKYGYESIFTFPCDQG